MPYDLRLEGQEPEEDQEDFNSFHETAKLEIMSLGLPEDEAENFLEDLGY